MPPGFSPAAQGGRGYRSRLDRVQRTPSAAQEIRLRIRASISAEKPGLAIEALSGRPPMMQTSFQAPFS